MRLDQYLFEHQLAQSRERAKALIMAGLVYVNGEKCEKSGHTVKDDAEVTVRGKDHSYVSRGGLKLEKALNVFEVSPKELVCMDVGASTGGFTDCMLQQGAKKVYAVDVGYGQLAWSLRNDERVVVMERTNIRKIEPANIVDKIAFFTIDVSFISVKHVFPVLNLLSADNCHGICLVKPQFEAGKDKVGKNGVVKELEAHIEVLTRAMEYAATHGFSVVGVDYSPIKGPKGNIEFLLCVEKSDNPQVLSDSQVTHVCTSAHEQLSDCSMS